MTTLQIEIDGKPVAIESGKTVMEAAESIGTYIPHFCYHRKLSIAANCRMCLVEVEKAPKPLPACATPVTDGMKVKTHSDLAIKAQKGVMEFLLINHPLDCPICDQGGECQLQDIAVGYGGTESRYTEEKRVVPNKDLGSLISTDMTRCIHCSRCVRFTDEIAGFQELGMAHRGEHTEVLPFISQTVNSEISGNIIDLCPVGALTSKPFRYSARTWELSRRKSVSPHDSLGSNLIVHVKDNQLKRVLPRENESINECWLSDRDRYAYEGLNSASRLTQPMLKQGGQWIEVDWQVALEYVARGLQDIKNEHGAQAITALAAPNSTNEELQLLQKVMHGIGSQQLEARLRQADTRAGALGLGSSIATFAESQAFWVVGSNLRKEQPLLAQRVRQAVKKGSALVSLNAVDYDFLVPVALKQLCAPAQWANALAGVYMALAEQKALSIPQALQPLLVNAQIGETSQAIAALLLKQPTHIVMGELAQQQPNYAVLVQLLQAIAQISGATLGGLPLANALGARLAGVSSTSAVVATQAQAYLLQAIDPENDTYLGAGFLGKLKAAKMVVCLNAFDSEVARQHADVLLPIAPFSETAGSFVNMEGRLQTFNGVVKPLGNTRPAWKVWRVLGNLLSLPGFDFNSVEDIRQANGWLQQEYPCVTPQQVQGAVDSAVQTEVAYLFERGLYQVDSLVRRAPSLQKTNDAQAQLLISKDIAQAKGLNAGDAGILTVDGESITLPVQIVDLPANCVRLIAATSAAMQLPSVAHAISIERA